MKSRGLVCATLVALAIAAACSGGEVRPDTLSGTSSATPTATLPDPSDIPTGVLTGPPQTATPGPTASPNNEEIATKAATKIIDEANVSRCATPAPECNLLAFGDPVAESSPELGLAVYNVTSTHDEPNVMVIGRNNIGQWYLYLWGKQFYNATSLPATVTICGFGAGAEVHSAANASSSVVSRLDDGETVNAEQFVLTQSGRLPHIQPLADPGYGFYRITEPAGWVYSKYVSATGDCALHDAVEPH